MRRRTSGTYTSAFCQVYPSGWITLGAHLLGRFDIVRMLMDGIVANYYDEEMGTFRSCCLPQVDRFDINSGAMAVELFTLTDIAKAKRAAEFVIRHLENQPDPDNWYYGMVDKSFDYVTTPDPRSATYSAIKIGEENQAFWFLGLSGAALVQLYQFTGDARYLEAGKKFFETFLRCGEPGFHAPGSGKSFWLASMLYRLTGEKKYLESAEKLMGFFFDIQQDDGTFLLPGMSASDAGPKFLFDTTPEYARWFFEVAAELSAVSRCQCGR